MLANTLLLYGGIWCACSELAAILSLERGSNKAALMSEAEAEAVAGRLLMYWKTIFVNYNDILNGISCKISCLSRSVVFLCKTLYPNVLQQVACKN